MNPRERRDSNPEEQGTNERKQWGLTGRAPQPPTAHPATQIAANLHSETSKKIKLTTSSDFQHHESAKYMTADDAYTHATSKEPIIRDLLMRLEYKGGYSLHAGFNEEMVHCGQRQEEIYLVLDADVSTEIGDALEEIFAPFPGIVYTTKGVYRIQTETPRLRSILSGENADDRNGEWRVLRTEEDGGGVGGSEVDDDHGPVTITIPFSSTISLKAVNAPKGSPTNFTTASCIEIIINKNRKSESPPPELKWPRPWISVDMTALDISTQRSCAELQSKYTFALAQISMLSSLTPASVLQSSPYMTHVQDTVKPKTEYSICGGIFSALASGLGLLLGLAKSPAVTVTADKTRHRWDIYSQLLGAAADDHSEGMSWTYLHNGSAGGELKGLAAERIELEPRPTLVLGYDISKNHILEVEVVVYWSLNATRSRQSLHPAFSSDPFGEGKGEGEEEIPAFMNFLHHLSVVVDIGNRAPEDPSILIEDAADRPKIKDLRPSGDITPPADCLA
ncbi:hypothetical protein FPV67DRAFT_586533 [Lyophyllum atratum]|nr:hypothetical protein FPV67DRAFT_586533 [Lyophyllum atratum]